MRAQFFEVDLPPVSERKVKLVDAVLPDTQKVRLLPFWYPPLEMRLDVRSRSATPLSC